MDSKLPFSWDLIGDTELGRPNLGLYTRVEVYRLMQYTFRHVIEALYGVEQADKVFIEAGKIAGKEFYRNIIKEAKDFNELTKVLHDKLIEFGIGILRIEKAELDSGELILTVGEDLDCSGLPVMDFEVCKYDEGFIAGILECFSGRVFTVKEIDCWCTGDRTCRFRATEDK